MKTFLHWLLVIIDINYEEQYWIAAYERDMHCHIISKILEKKK